MNAPAACVLPRVPAVLVVAVVLATVAAGLIAPGDACAAQPGSRGRITGKVLARDNGEPLGFAEVQLLPADSVGTRAGVQANADGTFALEAAPGAYVLQVRMISYRTKQVTGVVLAAGKSDHLDVALETDALQQAEVHVEARAVTSTEGAQLNARRKAASVGDAVSAEQVKKSPDRDVADVLKRVTGASIVDNKYVYVRGLGERYSSTSIDGVRVTSPEPAKRVVPLDLIPANLLDNVVVQKTYTADRPGEFGGGDVQVETKAFPGQRVFGFSFSQGWSEGTTFKDGFFTYEGASGDMWGFGSGGREMPSLVQDWAGHRKAQLSFDPANGFRGDSVETMGSSFSNVWSPRGKTPGPNGSAQLTFGDERRVFDRALGVVGSLSWSRTRNFSHEWQQFYENGVDQDLAASYDVRKSTESVLFGGTGGLSYRLAPAHTLHLRGTYSNSADDEVRQYLGYFKSQDQDYFNTRLRYVQRQIRAGSLGAEHDFPDLFRAKVSWRASLSASERTEPDHREYTYGARRDFAGNPAPDLTFSGASREFGRLDEDGKGFDVKVAVPLGGGRWSASRVEVGGSVDDRDRLSTWRRFGFFTTGSYGTATPPESIMAPGQWGNPGTGTQMNEGTLPEDSYEANQRTWAGFVSGDVAVTHRLRAIAGLRVEDGTQMVRTFDFFSGKTAVDGTTGREQRADLSNTDLLPSLNLVWQVGEGANLRLAAARTLSRPDIRELNPGTTLDYIGGFRFRGNPDLVRATIWNYDLRAELFPSVGEVLAASVFYKDFTHPIEYAILPSDQPLLSPINSESGRNVGVELESRVDLARLSRRLAGLSLNLNASIISSEIELGSGGGVGSRTHPLQGQSDYLVNVGLSWAERQGRWDGTLLVNRVGRRLVNLGYPPNDDIYDEPSTVVDAALNWRASRHWRLKLSGGNLFDASYLSTQGDKGWRFSKPGRTISLAVAMDS